MKTIKNYIYSSLYQIFLVIVPFLTIPYVSRVLGAELIGINSYTNTIMSYFVLFANLGITIYGNRTIAYYREDINKRSQKFWEIIILKFLVSAIVYGVFLVFVYFYPQYQFIFMLQSIQIIATAFDISWLFSGLEDFKKTVVRNFLVKTLSVLLIFLFVKTENDLNSYVLITVLATLAGNLTLWTYLKSYIVKVPLNTLRHGEHFLPVFFLFVPQVASTIFVSLNKILLGTLSTMEQTGYFDNADRIVRVLLALVSSISVVIFPQVANAFKNNDSQKVTQLTKLTFDVVNIIIVPMVVGIISISDVFSDLFFGPEFQGINIVLSILVLELLFMGYSSVLGSQYLVATGQSRYLSIAVIGGLISSGILSVLLIPSYGAVGAAIASVVGEVTIMIIEVYCLKKQINFISLCSDVPKYFLASLIMFVAIYLSGGFISQVYLNLVIRILLGILVYGVSLYVLRPQLLKDSTSKFAEFKKPNSL
ncbi:flippase [Streptococcus suis]|uniref:PST family polysaccharide transporter n=1 Tax=Streptococcus suis TaxID=1307 RepID=A0A0Z8KRC8_STRSU|nr:flippase [Streptococcus suis]MDW8713786.1 flippase [Streptococcus suis]NQG75408.1 flippase [Streptococcus suis]NQG79276.1 flippase [Streptococcus suis]NQK16222.1 flippase [Streptococcus suis]CYV77088.1 PST family polysaccharide transporter [Streptococcus suis]